MTAIGIPQEDVAKVIGIDVKTLYKYYREELDTAMIKANAAVGGKLYQKCMQGDTASILFWMKTKMGWKETSVQEQQLLDKNGNKADWNVNINIPNARD